MTLINKIREYVQNVSAYPKHTDTIEVKEFLGFLKSLESEHKTLSTETIEVVRRLIIAKLKEYPLQDVKQAQQEFESVYGGGE